MCRQENANTWRGRASWLTFSCLGIAYSFAVAATFPFFSTVMAIIASLGDLAGAYTLPAIFVLAILGSRLSRAERCLCYIIVPVTLALSVWGVVSSVMQLIHEFGKH
jgi:solute carrier family 32 (vesicular inhibitory amino acid transporter)